MTLMARQRLIASAVGLALALALQGVASAQSDTASGTDAGIVTGQVDRCVNGAEQPAAQVLVGIEGGSGSLARTDINGEFLLALPPGQYNVVATATDGAASRLYVPVSGGQSLDIGILDIGGSVSGCGPDSDITAPVLPTFTPVPVPTPQPPTAVPTAIPVPSTSTPIPDATPDATPEATPEPDPGA